MKKNYTKYNYRLCIILITVICMLLSLISCEDYKVTEKNILNNLSDPFDERDNMNETTIEYSIGLSDKSENLIYEGQNVNATIEVENGSEEVELGFIVFVDGFCVPFSLDKKSINNMSTVNLKSCEKSKHNLSFSPESGKKNDCLEVQIACIVEPNYIPSFNSGDCSFGINHTMDALRTKLIMKTNAKKYKHNVKIQKPNGTITDELRETFLLDENDYTTEQYEQVMRNAELPLSERKPDVTFAPNNIWGYNSYNDLNKTNIKISNQSVFKYNIMSMASEKYTYRTTIFINNKPVKTIDGYDCIETNLSLSEYAIASLQCDISSFSNETVIIYAIAVPTSGANDCWTRAIKTHSLALIIS